MTIKDLSSMTGYSVGTISRVLNDQPNVSQKARETILKAARESGFQLNENAKQLKQSRSNAVLLVVKGTSNELFGNLVEALQSQLAQTPYVSVVDYIDEDANEVRRAVQLCREKKPLGVLFLGGTYQNFLSDFGEIDTPCVLITNDGSGLPFDNLSSVTSDDRQAACQVIDRLIRLGHRQIAVIGGDRETSDISRLRFSGCRDAFGRHNIRFESRKGYETARFSFADGYRAAKELMRRNPDATAIFAMSDVMAIGAIRALWDMGLRVPEDVSVVGFDGLSMGGYTVPKLASVTQDVEALALHSIKILRENIEGNGTVRHEILPVSLSWNESAKPIAK